MDRRVPVFLICSVLAGALAPFAKFGEDDFRWMAAAVSATYFLLAVLVLVDWLGRRSRGSG